MKLSAQIRHAYELLSEGKRTCVCTHIQRPHKCTWSVKGVCAYGCLPVKLLEPVSLCITSSASWHFPTVSKLGDREASEASSKASSLQKDRGKNQAVNQKGGSLYYTEQTSWCNTREQITYSIIRNRALPEKEVFFLILFLPTLVTQAISVIFLQHLSCHL